MRRGEGGQGARESSLRRRAERLQRDLHGVDGGQVLLHAHAPTAVSAAQAHFMLKTVTIVVRSAHLMPGSRPQEAHANEN